MQERSDCAEKAKWWNMWVWSTKRERTITHRSAIDKEIWNIGNSSSARMLFCVGFNIFVLYQKIKRRIILFVCLFLGMLLLSWLGSMGTCLLNKCWKWRQNDVRMRVERMHKMMEGEYVCCLIWRYSDQRVCMNIIRLHDWRIRDVLAFYVLGIWAMK